MYKFLYCQDLHLRGNSPENRIDNYTEAVFAKLQQILDLSRTKECDSIICGGDLWDTPIVSNSICDRALDLIESNGKPFYSIYGNHDELNHEVSLSDSTTLSHMFRRSKIFQRLTNLDVGWKIEGVDYSHNIESKLPEIIKGKKQTVFIVHALITPNEFLPNVTYIEAKNLGIDPTSYVLCGHYHQPFLAMHVINIGCVGRTSIDEKNIDPSVLYIELDKDMTVYPLTLTTAKGEDVFDLKAIELAKAFDSSMENFVNQLQTSQVRGRNLRDMVENFAKENKIERPIVDEIIARIGKHENA